jgi:hypothetical protein
LRGPLDGRNLPGEQPACMLGLLDDAPLRLLRISCNYLARLFRLFHDDAHTVNANLDGKILGGRLDALSQTA